MEGLDFCPGMEVTGRRGRNCGWSTHYVPVLEAIREWLRSQRFRVLPKSGLGNALTYCVKQWEKQTIFVKEGRLELDNNRSDERSRLLRLVEKLGIFPYVQVSEGQRHHIISDRDGKGVPVLRAGATATVAQFEGRSSAQCVITMVSHPARGPAKPPNS